MNSSVATAYSLGGCTIDESWSTGGDIDDAPYSGSVPTCATLGYGADH